MNMGHDPSHKEMYMTSRQDLAGKTALVTGGSRGIGAAIARTLAAAARA
jgi:3-oxoacyl-[acyl-carrier protein] reductase